VLLLASVTFAAAQSNGVPGPQDYAAFAHFVADRNIFDPSRQPHSYVPGYRPRPRRVRSTGAPDLQLVGTMSYEKGLFAFFNGNNSDLKKALQAGDKIADFTITAISVTNVVLETADKKDQLTLNVGDGLRQENGKWVRPESAGSPAPLPSVANAPESAAPASAEDASPEPATPASAAEPNDVLKRLMQQREKENQ
jgi:hypothetical protein